MADVYEPPRKGDRLFRHDLPDDYYNACLNPSWGDADHGYTEGYRRGARLLVEHVVEHQRNQDYLVYPIIFLYRHHIELALKNILRRVPYLLDRELTQPEESHLNKHRLDLLWQDLRLMINAVGATAGWGPFNPAELEGIDEHITQLSAMDPDSYAFRYTRSKKGNPALPPDVKLINLRHFAEMIERLGDALDGLDMATSHLEDAKAEMEAEWQRSSYP
jgi:hypothetical protein